MMKRVADRCEILNVEVISIVAKFRKNGNPPRTPFHFSFLCVSSAPPRLCGEDRFSLNQKE
jgi:hypothetical protein